MDGVTFEQIEEQGVEGCLAGSNHQRSKCIFATTDASSIHLLFRQRMAQEHYAMIDPPIALFSITTVTI